MDKWLWTSRLFKTRTQASDAAAGGRININGTAVKPSKDVRVEDEIHFSLGSLHRAVVVRGLAERRVPPAQVPKVYEETPESLQRVAAHRELRRLAGPVTHPGGRPTKRDRRRYDSGR